MRKILSATAACGIAALGIHAEDGAKPSMAYVSSAVLQSAEVNLSGEGFPGASVEVWLEKPAEQVVFLKGGWDDLLGEIHRLGDVSVLSGNETIMHLATGQYDPYRGGEGHALVLNQGIDLRLFPGHWEYGAAVLPASGSAPGFIFFNGAGDPVHRILLTSASNVAEFDALVAEYKGEKPEFAPWSEATEPTVAPTEETKVAFLEAWRGITDTHQFSGLLREHKLSRTDALHLAEGEFTAQLDPAAYASIFGQLVDGEISIILFALNDGCVQISTGAIDEINRAKGTLQLVEDDSRTLVALPRIAEVWRVSKPTKKGLAHSLELYDAHGEPVAYIFGTAKEDNGNVEKWNEVLFALPVNGAGAVKVAGETADAPAASSEAEKKECPSAKAASSEEEVAETTEAPAPSEVEAKVESTEAAADKAEATPAKVDTFNLPRRIRSQITYTTKRMLEFDKNSDGLLAQDELPKRMQGVIAKGDLNADALLDKEELTQMAYNQIQKREAKAEAEPIEKR